MGPRGSANGASKLQEWQVRAIRSLYQAPGWQETGEWFPGNSGDLGRRFGINRRTVRSIADGEIWGWLD